MKKTVKNIAKRVLCGLLAVMTLCSCAACNIINNNKDSSSGGEVVEVERTKYFVQDGKTDYTVVIAKNASETEICSAEQLVELTQQVSGANLSVKLDNEVSYGSEQKLICIGKNSLFKRTGIEITSEMVNTDGFVIKSVGDMIFINGYYDRGTIYGVYEFIETYLGVKFLTAEVTYVPENKDIMIEEKLDILEAPDFEARHYYVGTMRDPKFLSRMRMTAGGGDMLTKYGGGFRDTWYDSEWHNTMKMLKTSPYFEENKEEWLNNKQTNICYTHGITEDGEVDETMEISVVKAMAEALKTKILDSSPTQKFFMIGQEDNQRPCDCKRCTDRQTKYGNKTGLMIVFMNAIAKYIESWAKETIPNKEYYISCFAYQWSAAAPTKVDETTGKLVPVHEHVIPHKTVYVAYAPIEACYYHAIEDESCTKNKSIRGEISGWGAITDRMLIWDYHTNFRHALFWFPNTGILTENLRTYYNYGVIFVRAQTDTSDNTSYQKKLFTYVMSKLMWDFDQDVYDIIHEFNKYYFEEVAEYINQFIDLYEGHFAMLNIHTELFENTPQFLAAETYPLQFLENALALTEKAKAIINDSDRTKEEKKEFINRIDRVALHPLYMIIKNINSYGLSEADKQSFVGEFFRLLGVFEVSSFGESRIIQELKERYGF